MHFAYPPRKASNPPPFRPRAAGPAFFAALLRRHRAKAVVAAIVGFLLLLYAVAGLLGGRRSPYDTRLSVARGPSGRPPVVIVTTLDPTHRSLKYIETVRENRLGYAQKHGYEAYFPKISDYDLQGSPFSWTKVVALRDVLTRFPDCRHVWYLDQDSLIMQHNAKLEDRLLRAKVLEGQMLVDLPVVPPDSIIHTFSHVKGDDVDLVLTQDREGLSTASFILRNSDWTRYLLETWFDPLYRSYNFLKAETHALEHIVQWHPTILSKLAVVPQRAINAYSRHEKGDAYQDGDLVVRFAGCTDRGDTACETEQRRFLELRQKDA